MSVTCHLASKLASLLVVPLPVVEGQVQVGAPHHLAPASEHSAAGVLLVLLLPDQGEVQVHVLCHLQYQVQAGILQATLSRGISNLNSKSGI